MSNNVLQVITIMTTYNFIKWVLTLSNIDDLFNENPIKDSIDIRLDDF
jgi:hypothetical protein